MTTPTTRQLVHLAGRDVVFVDMDGIGRVMLVLPSVPVHGSQALKDGIARRRLTMTDGVCPCGALLEVTRSGAQCAHEPDCPARDMAVACELRRAKA